MLYMGYLIILDGQSIEKNQFQKFPFLSCQGWSCISRFCPCPLGTPPPPQPPQ